MNPMSRRSSAMAATLVFVPAAPERGDTLPSNLDLDDHFGVRVEASGGDAIVDGNAVEREEDLSAT